jgi:hypothetical protein
MTHFILSSERRKWCTGASLGKEVSLVGSNLQRNIHTKLRQNHLPTEVTLIPFVLSVDTSQDTAKNQRSLESSESRIKDQTERFQSRASSCD